jgi:hypothetical protein
MLVELISDFILVGDKASVITGCAKYHVAVFADTLDWRPARRLNNSKIAFWHTPSFPQAWADCQPCEFQTALLPGAS